MGDDEEYDRNQLAAKSSWEKVASAIVYFNEPQSALSSPKTRFIPSEPYPFVRDMVDLCADQDDWCALINADIVVMPYFHTVLAKLKARKASCASSWRWNFDPAVGVNTCARNDNGLDFFMALPGAWDIIHGNMEKTPQGEHDAAKHLRFGAPTWDSWLQGAFFKLFSHRGLYDISDTRVIRHPIHGGRKHGTGVPPVHLIGWPVMGQSIL